MEGRYQMLRDFYLVWVDQIWESKETKSGLITSNTNFIAKQNASEEVEDRGEFKRRYGYVMEVPASFSDNDVEMIDPGLPTPRRYVGHDWLQMMRIAGYRGYREHETPFTKYYPSTFERYETIKMSDIGKMVDAKVGDLVYFDHKSTDVERYMGPFKEGHLFSIQVNEIMCVVKESAIFAGYNKYKERRIFPQGGWVFVKLNMESWEDITLPGTDIVIKCAPEALPLQGKVVAAQNKKLEGKNVLFERDADAPITIGEQELTVMPESDILATIK